VRKGNDRLVLPLWRRCEGLWLHSNSVPEKRCFPLAITAEHGYGCVSEKADEARFGCAAGSNANEEKD
jgi:hypothetical protein